jgi:hypothetical protein
MSAKAATNYAVVFLRWLKPYAFLTLRDGRWLTR